MAERRTGELDATLDAATAVSDGSLDATIAAASGSLDATIAAGDGSSAGPPAEPRTERYEVMQEVGRGGLGRVLSARDARLDRVVALKVLLDDGAGLRPRFEREARITARLEHPSIVPVYDASPSAEGAPFYAMRLVSGSPLSDAIDAAPTLERRLELLPNVLAVAHAVAYAHAEGVVHRDIKPHNVLIGAHGETIVIDWGLALDLGAGEREAPGSVQGTPGYMAPEQARGDAVDARADVYAIGAMLYQLVSGRMPHDGGTLSEVLDHARRGEHRPLAEHEPRAAPELVAIVEKALAAAPSDRYPTAAQLAEDLRRFMTGQIVGAHRYTLGARVARFAKRHAAALSVIAALVALAGWASWSIAHERAMAADAARLELELAADGVRRDVAASLDQAAPLLANLRALADPALPLSVVAPRMRELAVARPGVSNLSIGFSTGLMRGTFIGPDGDVLVQESVVSPSGTTRRDYRIDAPDLKLLGERTSSYDVRKRPHYELATRAGTRVWTAPRVYATSHATGITCAELVLDAKGAPIAVTTVDFDVARLSAIVEHPPFDRARTIVFAGDGTVLAHPTPLAAAPAAGEARLLRHEDLHDPVLEALFTALGGAPVATRRFFELRSNGETYLAAVAPIGGRRAGVSAPLDWAAATIAPADALLAPIDGARPARAVLVAALALALAVAGWLVTRPRFAAHPRTEDS